MQVRSDLPARIGNVHGCGIGRGIFPGQSRDLPAAGQWSVVEQFGARKAHGTRRGFRTPGETTRGRAERATTPRPVVPIGLTAIKRLNELFTPRTDLSCDF